VHDIERARQVATDLRLWVRETGAAALRRLRELVGVVVARAEADIDVLMPGYTHLQVCTGTPAGPESPRLADRPRRAQRAQPIRWSHWVLMYGWMWQADAERLTQLLARANVMPLGTHLQRP
jgi:argininosuccinate lyase